MTLKFSREYIKSQVALGVHGVACGYPLFKAITTGDIGLSIAVSITSVCIVLGMRWARRDVIAAVTAVAEANSKS